MQCYLNFCFVQLVFRIGLRMRANNTGSDNNSFCPPPLTRDKVPICICTCIYIPVKAFSISLIFIKFMAVIIHVHVYRYLIKHRTKINRLEFFLNSFDSSMIKFFFFRTLEIGCGISISYFNSINTNGRYL